MRRWSTGCGGSNLVTWSSRPCRDQLRHNSYSDPTTSAGVVQSQPRLWRRSGMLWRRSGPFIPRTAERFPGGGEADFATVAPEVDVGTGRVSSASVTDSVESHASNDETISVNALRVWARLSPRSSRRIRHVVASQIAVSCARLRARVVWSRPGSRCSANASRHQFR